MKIITREVDENILEVIVDKNQDLLNTIGWRLKHDELILDYDIKTKGWIFKNYTLILKTPLVSLKHIEEALIKSYDYSGELIK